MNIRLATPKDAGKVRAISLELNVPRTSVKDSGFVEYPTPSIEEYERRMRDNPFFHVAEQRGVIIGFSAAYSDDLLSQLDLEGDEVAQHILRKPRPFVYWDQLAFVRAYQNRQHGPELARHFISSTSVLSSQTIWGAISHSPKRNNRIIELVGHLEFTQDEEITTSSGLTFGIYRKEINS